MNCTNNTYVSFKLLIFSGAAALHLHFIASGTKISFLPLIYWYFRERLPCTSILLHPEILFLPLIYIFLFGLFPLRFVREVGDCKEEEEAAQLGWFALWGWWFVLDDAEAGADSWEASEPHGDGDVTVCSRRPANQGEKPAIRSKTFRLWSACYGGRNRNPKRP